MSVQAGQARNVAQTLLAIKALPPSNFLIPIHEVIFVAVESIGKEQPTNLPSVRLWRFEDGSALMFSTADTDWSEVNETTLRALARGVYR